MIDASMKGVREEYYNKWLLSQKSRRDTASNDWVLKSILKSPMIIAEKDKGRSRSKSTAKGPHLVTLRGR